MHLQMQAVQGLCADPSGNLRSLGIPELLDHLRSACLFCEEEIRELREVLMIPSAVIAAARVTADASLVKSLDETPPERQEVNDVLVDAADSAPFFLAVLGKRRLLRLHKAGGCPATPSELREVIPLWSLDGAEYHFACKHCWRKGSQPVDTSRSSSESSAGDSSSTIARSVLIAIGLAATSRKAFPPPYSTWPGIARADAGGSGIKIPQPLQMMSLPQPLWRSSGSLFCAQHNLLILTLGIGFD